MQIGAQTTLPAIVMLIVAVIPDLARAEGAMNGRWSVTRTATDRCPAYDATFLVSIRNGVVRAPGGIGSVSASGTINFDGRDNRFSGQIRGAVGSGTYTGRCSGTFRMTRQ